MVRARPLACTVLFLLLRCSGPGGELLSPQPEEEEKKKKGVVGRRTF